MSFRTQLVLLARLVVGVVFIYASLDKIAHPGDFAEAIGNYHVLPWGLENLLGLTLSWLELLIGLCLIFGIMLDGAALLSAGLLMVFIVAISQALARGIDIECGCFKVSSPGEKVGLKRIIEDLIYLGLTWLILFRKERKWELFPRSIDPATTA
ncbi:MAG: MauE/DoxX family redox-associated membrane protein [Fidelibacterota bacterium]